MGRQMDCPYGQGAALLHAERAALVGGLVAGAYGRRA
jgi:hypothetical protein